MKVSNQVTTGKNQTFTNIIDGIKVTFRQVIPSDSERKSQAIQDILIRATSRQLAK